MIDINKWQSQVRKGILEFLILLVLEKREHYGYELVKIIKDSIFDEFSEGTIYPLLTRLQKSNLIKPRWETQETGMPRKYYEITDEGRNALKMMKATWAPISVAIQKLVNES